MNRRNFLRGSVNAVSIMALAATLKFQEPQFQELVITGAEDFERFKLIDPSNGVFEYTGDEPFDGTVEMRINGGVLQRLIES